MKIYNAIDVEYKILPLPFKRKFQKWLSSLGFKCFVHLRDEERFMMTAGVPTTCILYLFCPSLIFTFKALPVWINLTLSSITYSVFITGPVLGCIYLFLKKVYNE